MKCIRCNKDFQEGEGNLCPECKKKFELEQATSQNAKTVKINPFKRFYSNKVKMYLTQKEKVKNLAIGLGALIVLIIIIASVKGNGGNIDILGKIGNLREYGYADRDNGWIYYVAPDSELSKMGIYKIKENGDKPKELNTIGKYDIMSINAYNNYLYFIVQSSSSYSKDGDTFDNKIYKMKNDGTELEVINDNITKLIKGYNVSIELDYNTIKYVEYILKDTNIINKDYKDRINITFETAVDNINVIKKKLNNHIKSFSIINETYIRK